MKIKKNGKVVNLTESDLQRIVKRVLNERQGPKSFSVSVSKQGKPGKLEISDVSAKRRQRAGEGTSECLLFFKYKIIEGENELFKQFLNDWDGQMEGYGEYLCDKFKDDKPVKSEPQHPIPQFRLKIGGSSEFPLDVETPDLLSNWCSNCSNLKVGDSL
jgi:hypothetical protein